MDKSRLFSTYNKARSVSRGNKRVDRALGLAQTNGYGSPYNTTPFSCDCPDSQYRKKLCKHRIALYLRAVSEEE